MCDMLEVRTTAAEEGYRLTICRRRVEGFLRKKIVFEPISDWDNGIAELHPLAAAILDDLQSKGSVRRLDASRCVLTFAGAAGLENADAVAINLLPAFPYQLEIQIGRAHV